MDLRAAGSEPHPHQGDDSTESIRRPRAHHDNTFSNTPVVDETDGVVGAFRHDMAREYQISAQIFGHVNFHLPLSAFLGNVSFNHPSSGLIGNVSHHYSPEFFGGLRALASGLTNDAAARYRGGRQSRQSVSGLPIMPTRYLPHVYSSQPELNTALIRIAVVCQFLDAAFAEYFRVVVGGVEGTDAKLAQIRAGICSCQSDSIEYVGELGLYCERVNARAQDTDSVRDDERAATETDRYDYRATGDDIQPYLQDALEVPYWNMMADQFIKSNHVNNQFTYDAVLCIINDKRRELKLRLRQMKDKWYEVLPQEIEDGIARRLYILDAILAQCSPGHHSMEEEQVRTMQRSPTSELAPTSLSAGSTVPPASSRPQATASSNMNDVTDLEKVSSLSLFLVFTATAMIPFSMGFAGNWNAKSEDAVGSTADPDFKWLIATNLLVVFGNTYAIVPLLKATRGSLASTISTGFLCFSVLLGIVSVAVYPFLNKAWSCSSSFFCAFFAIGSVFISARHASNTVSPGPSSKSKVKKK